MIENPTYSNLKFLLTIILSGFCFLSYSQEEDILKQQQKLQQKANDLVYDANELLSDDQFVTAEKEYRKAISTEGSNVAGNYNLANSYYEKGSYDEALFRQTEAAKVATNKTERHSAYHNIGNILMKKKMCKEAVEAFKNALRNDPTDDESRYNLVIAKECAEQQQDQQNDENDKDKDKDKEKEDKDEEKKDGDNEEKEDNKDQKDENKDQGEDNKEDEGKPKDENKDQKDGQDQQEKPQQPKPQPGQLSPQQIKSLLEAMNNQEQKVQEKLNAEKLKGPKVNTDKDW